MSCIPMDTFSITGSAESYRPCNMAALHLNTNLLQKNLFHLWVLFKLMVFCVIPKWVEIISPHMMYTTSISQKIYWALWFLLYVVNVRWNNLFIIWHMVHIHTTKYSDVPLDSPKKFTVVRGVNLYRLSLSSSRAPSVITVPIILPFFTHLLWLT